MDEDAQAASNEASEYSSGIVHQRLRSLKKTRSRLVVHVAKLQRELDILLCDNKHYKDTYEKKVHWTLFLPNILSTAKNITSKLFSLKCSRLQK